MADVFLSHASVDRPLVEAFAVNLLEPGAGLTHNQVYCTSLEGQGMPPGVDFKEHIQTALSDAACVVALITPNYYASAFCLCELGAAWVLSKRFFPVIVPPVTFQDLKGVLQGMQCLEIGKDRDLDQIRDTVSHFVAKPTSTARWNTRRNAFLSALPALLDALPSPRVIKPQELALAINQRDEYKQLSEELDSELTDLKQRYQKVSALKDRAQIVEIEREQSDEWDIFQELLKSAKGAIGELPWGGREGLYYWIRGEAWNPWEYSDVDSANQAAERSFLVRDRNGHFHSNENKPLVRDAMNALNDLKAFIEKASPELHDQYESQYKDNLDVASRDFWKLLRR